MRKLIYARKIYASFKPLRTYKSLLVEDGVVKGLYNDYVSLGDVDEVIDLRNHYIIPSFIDAHVHLDSVGEKISQLDISNARSIEEIARELQKSKGKGWVIGRGFDHEKLREKRMPTKHDLDKVIDDRPVIIIRVDGHSAVLNSYALEILRIKSEDGIIKENELFKALEAIKKERSIEDEKEIMTRAQEEFLKNGVTSVGFMSCDLKSLYALRELRREGKLKLRVMCYLTPSAFEKEKKRDDGDEILRVNGIKLFADGSFGSRTALLSTPYSDDPTNYGIEVTKKEEMLEYCKEANDYGLQCAIHAIGDKGLDNVLYTFENLKNNVKNRIEHASLVREDQFARLKKVSPAIVVQPHFTVSDFWIVDRLGEERVKNVYPFKRLIDEGLNVAFSTDAPVEPINPWETIDAAINRGVLRSYNPEESVSLIDALDCYTRQSAIALVREDLGMLMNGYKADFVVIDDDIDSKPEILQTYLNGELVYSRERSIDKSI